MSANRLSRALVLCAAGAILAALAPVHAAGRLCKLEISANDLMRYDRKELHAAADCTVIQVKLTHTGKLPASAMGHNWVLVESKDLEGVANAGAAAGFTENYLAPGDPRIIAATRLIGGGQSTTVTFPASRLKLGRSYMYLCTAPGHNALMRGIFHYGG
ncbi:MAG TPA: azurin [Steroidobacteraceae bacterium]|nr:azurin [Steroidobacteraceae bacterium]